MLIDKLLMEAKIARPAGYANQPKSHNAVAVAVVQGRADWGVAIEPAANLYGLAFLTLAPEQYDFLLIESRSKREAVLTFLKALKNQKVKERIRALGMELERVMAQLTDDCFAFSGPLMPVEEMERLIEARVTPVAEREVISLLIHAAACAARCDSSGRSSAFR